MTELVRRLGVTSATSVGVAAMLGAGIFFVWGPAARLAGVGVLVALPVAALVAALNALSTTQLAMRYPVSGGAYAYGRAELSPLAGFSAGVLFLLGKTASVAAIAVIAGGYLWPGWERAVAVALIVALSVLNATGVRSTAIASAILAAIVIAALVATVVVGAARGAAHPSATVGSITPLGVLQAASLIFYSFAGYARIATLSEEVRDPRRTLPRAVVLALSTVFLLSAVVAVALVALLGVDALAASTSPLADLVGPGWRPVVAVAAAVACAGSLLGVLAGLSRTSLAMARDGELPRPLAQVSPRTATPVRAQLIVSAVGIGAALLADPTVLVGLSTCAVLGYYGLAHASALRLSGGDRWLPRWIPIVGLVCCAALALAAPWPAVVATITLLGLAVGVRAIVRRHRGTPAPA
ncbi:APC family permease [soil metagenome]